MILNFHGNLIIFYVALITAIYTIEHLESEQE